MQWSDNHPAFLLCPLKQAIRLRCWIRRWSWARGASPNVGMSVSAMNPVGSAWRSGALTLTARWSSYAITATRSNFRSVRVSRRRSAWFRVSSAIILRKRILVDCGILPTSVFCGPLGSRIISRGFYGSKITFCTSEKIWGRFRRRWREIPPLSRLSISTSSWRKEFGSPSPRRSSIWTSRRRCSRFRCSRFHPVRRWRPTRVYGLVDLSHRTYRYPGGFMFWLIRFLRMFVSFSTAVTQMWGFNQRIKWQKMINDRIKCLVAPTT